MNIVADNGMSYHCVELRESDKESDCYDMGGSLTIPSMNFNVTRPPVARRVQRCDIPLWWIDFDFLKGYNE